MSTISPSRPSRRAATRKKVIVDDSDEDVPGSVSPQEDNEEGDTFTPAPQRSPRRQTRQKTVEAPSTLRSIVKDKRAQNGDNLVPSQIFEPDQSLLPEPTSPTKRSSPRKRKHVPAPRKGRVSMAIDPSPQLPTPKPSITPEVSQLHGTPLADITNATINEQTQPLDFQKDIVAAKPVDSVLEKPMDIVIRSRALGVPSAVEPIGPKNRTVIKYLVLTNFKSYAGRQEVGPFHASFSSVVGPNGSGKSNVIDSLLFVFGFRASKMRQGKISALIHNSAAFPNLDFCEVEVHFEEVRDIVSRGIISIL